MQLFSVYLQSAYLVPGPKLGMTKEIRHWSSSSLHLAGKKDINQRNKEMLNCSCDKL
jgi:hypothetical protein